MPVSGPIAEEIAAHGPIGLDRFMDLALYHPEEGYYMRQDPFGVKGDFTTAPEISQLFGEMLGLWCIHSWQQLGRPYAWQLVEIGPGRGTLMSDMIRVFHQMPDAVKGLRIHMVETSPSLTMIQQNVLHKLDYPIVWHRKFSEVPSDAPTLLIGNEFLDALPIRQFEYQHGQWKERRVTIGEAGTFVFVLADVALPYDCKLPERPEDGAVVEYVPALGVFLRKLSALFKAQTGAALFIDYGYNGSKYGDSLQALRAHAYAEPLEQPGMADLTAHVNFAAVANGAVQQGLEVQGPVTQREFLSRLGIGVRLHKLMHKAQEDQKLDLLSGVDRLVSPDAMGDLFKVIALCSPGTPALEGFAGHDL